MATDTNLLRGDKSIFRGKRPFSWKIGEFHPAKTEQAITALKAAKSRNPNVVPSDFIWQRATSVPAA